MAVVRPFRALRPAPDRAADVACVPYDVVSSAEARALAAGRPTSFLHVVRPEVGLPDDVDEHADAVYQSGADALARFAREGTLVEEPGPALYAYRLTWQGRAQTGVFGLVSVADYDAGRIVRHELTRPDKEDDRTRHLVAQRAHAEPVMLAHADDAAVSRLLDAATAEPPLLDVDADDGAGGTVRHTLWRIPDPTAVVAAFAALPRLYVADGHHRCKAASRAYHELAARGEAGPDDEAAFFPAALFPFSEMRILPYHRLVKAWPVGMGREDFLAALRERFDVRAGASPTPQTPGAVSLYVGGGTWLGLTLPETAGPNVADGLDVARLGEHVLGPLLGITDVRTDARLAFVGGIRGPEALKAAVDAGDAVLGIAMHPTGIDDLVAVSDAGELMPPKSTWFEPKLRSGLLVHRF